MGRAESIFQELEADGEAALDRFIAERASEELYLDFKRAATNAQTRGLQQDDRNNLARALSGFGNTAGGVIVWGIDCRDSPAGDIARSKFAVADAAKFRSQLEGAVSGSTLPPHHGVESRVIAKRDDGSGFVATLIPAADNVPLQVPSEWRYYMRSGSSFAPIPHQILAAMFGRRPAPTLEIDATVSAPVLDLGPTCQATATITIRNIGPGIARGLFASLQLVAKPSPQGKLAIEDNSDDRMEPLYVRPEAATVTSKQVVSFPPGSGVDVFVIKLQIDKDEIEGDLELQLTAGCENGPSAHRAIQQRRSRLKHSMELISQGTSKLDLLWLAQRIFGLGHEPWG